MDAEPDVRIDKWLWAVRIFKTRTLAAEACREGKVTVGGQTVKASRAVKVDDLVVAKTETVTRTGRVLKVLERRVGADKVGEYLEDHTPASEYERQREPIAQPLFVRPKGSGRPTKKERRALNPFLSELGED